MQLNESQTRIPKCLRIVKFFPGLKELDSARYFNICFSFFFRKKKIITKIVSVTFQALALREKLFTYIYYTHIHIYTYIHIYIYTYNTYNTYNTYMYNTKRLSRSSIAIYLSCGLLVIASTRVAFYMYIVHSVR